MKNIKKYAPYIGLGSLILDTFDRIFEMLSTTWMKITKFKMKVHSGQERRWCYWRRITQEASGILIIFYLLSWRTPRDPGASDLLLNWRDMPNKPPAISRTPKAKLLGPLKDFVKCEGVIKVGLLFYSSYDCSPNYLEQYCKYFSLLTYLETCRATSNKPSCLPICIYDLMNPSQPPKPHTETKPN